MQKSQFPYYFFAETDNIIFSSIHFSLLLVYHIRTKFVDSFILRNECMLDGQFVVRHAGKVLLGAVLFTSEKNELDCQTACLKDSRCKSINVNVDSGSRCQLNDRVLGDNGTYFTKKKGWIYQTTDFSATQVKLLIFIGVREMLRLFRLMQYFENILMQGL